MKGKGWFELEFSHIFLLEIEYDLKNYYILTITTNDEIK
jgi:hypothetical protein